MSTSPKLIQAPKSSKQLLDIVAQSGLSPRAAVPFD
jgi:hypothetical protein